MKKRNRKQLIGVIAGAVILLIALLVLLFSCESESERVELLYPAVEMAEAHSGAAASLITKPKGYPEEIGSALAMMMNLHKDDESYLYHVAFRDGEAGDASTKDSIAGRLKNPRALYAKNWVELATDPSQTQGWQYFLFTAEEIRTLASAGIECRFVGSGESFSEDGTGTLSWEEAVEHICQWVGDSFRAKTGG